MRQADDKKIIIKPWENKTLVSRVIIFLFFFYRLKGADPGAGSSGGGGVTLSKAGGTPPKMFSKWRGTPSPGSANGNYQITK